MLRSHGHTIPFRLFKTLKSKMDLKIEQINFALIVPNITFLRYGSQGVCQKFIKMFPEYNNETITKLELLGLCDNAKDLPLVEFDRSAGLTFIQDVDYLTFLSCGRVDVSSFFSRILFRI